MRYLIFLILFITCPPYLSVAQNDQDEKVLFYNLRLHYGSMIIHSRDLKDIGNAYPFGIELSIVKQSLGQVAWESCNCYPRKGFTVGLWNFNKPEILGNGYSANFFLEPVFGGWNNFFFTVKAMMGIAYLTNPYDSLDNPFNLSYSTHLSFPLHLGFIGNLRINRNFDASLGLIYNHVSNGGLKEPNKGINWPTLNFGIDYKPNFYLPERRAPSAYDQNDEKLTNFVFLSFATFKQLNHSELKKFLIAGGSVEGNRRVSKLSSLVTGIDLEWDETDREEIRRSDTTSTDHKKGGIFAGHKFLLGRFTFSQSIGVYLYAPYNPNDPVYQHYSLLYRPGKNLLIGIRLKAHRHVADYLAFEAGYRLF